MGRTWTVNQKLLAGCLSLLLLVLVAGGVATWSASSIRARGQDTVASGELVRVSGELKQLNSEIFASERSMVLAALLDDRAMLDQWTGRLQEDIDAADKKSQQLAAAMKGSARHADALKVQQNMAAWSERCGGCHEFADQIKTNPGRVLAFSKTGESLMQSSNDVIDTIQAAQQQAFAAQSASASSTYNQSRILTAVTFAVSLLVGTIVVMVVRRISRRLAAAAESLRAGTSQLASTASQVSDSAQSLSKGATDQAASLEETSAAMEELTAMTKQNADRAGTATELMLETDRHVHESNAALGEMTASMAGIREASARVSAIIKTIDQIAFQTNILALNAAVEAARAGEAGMGFAVVADEVRALAQRSAQAAGDTATLIAESMQKSADGAAKVEQVTSAIVAVTDNVTKVKGLVEEVSAASAQQSQGIVQIAQAITQMERVTQQTAGTAEESAAASEELHAQVRQTSALVDELDAMVHGGEREEAPDAAGPPAQAPRALTRAA